MFLNEWQSDVFEKNRNCLTQCDPKLIQSLPSKTSSPVTFFYEGSFLNAKISSPDEKDQILHHSSSHKMAELPRSPRLIILGLGLGYDFQKLVPYIPKGRYLYIFQKKPYIFLATLALFDWTHLINNLNITFVIGEKPPNEIKALFKKKNGLFWETHQIIQLPLCEHIDTEYYKLTSSIITDFGHKKINRLQKTYQALENQLITWYKKKDSQPRPFEKIKLLAYKYRDHNIYQYTTEYCINALKRAGFATKTTCLLKDPSNEKKTLLERVYAAASTYKPHILFTLTYLPQELFRFAKYAQHLLLVTWIVDDPFIYYSGMHCLEDNNFLISADPTWSQYIRKKYNYKKKIFFLPRISTNLTHRKHHTSHKKTHNISFVGSINTANYDIKEYLRQFYSQESASTIWARIMQYSFEQLRPDNLYEIHDKLNKEFELSDRIGQNNVQGFFYELTKELSAYKRLLYLNELRDLGIAFYGRLYLQPHFPQANFKPILSLFRGAFTYGNIFQLYRETKININIRKVHVPNAFCQRDWDVMCAKEFVLNESFDDLKNHFIIHEEIAVFQGQKDIRRQTEYYLNNPNIREMIIEKNHKRLQKNLKSLKSLPDIINEILTPYKGANTHLR